MAENRQGTHAGSVVLGNTLVKDTLKEFEVRPHIASYGGTRVSFQAGTSHSETDFISEAVVAALARASWQRRGVRIATASDAAELFAPLFEGLTQEKLAVAHLDGGRRLLSLVEIEATAADRIDLPVRRIMGDALRLGAHGLVLAHNHPSGDPTPSSADIDGTRDLADTGARLGIRIHDHLILAGGEFLSLRSLGLL